MPQYLITFKKHTIWTFIVVSTLFLTAILKSPTPQNLDCSYANNKNKISFLIYYIIGARVSQDNY